jgi:glyoxylase-like metal-dependent hydrolase (beta-lactamase superfamily II)
MICRPQWLALWMTALTMTIASADAAAPKHPTQAPGYYRLMLGDFEVTALSDGTFPMPIDKILANLPAGQIQAALNRHFLTDPPQMSVNGFLINTGDKLVLIDTGAGVFFGPTVGKLLTSLRASGYEPAQIDDVFITHMHADHIGGLIVDRKAAFPNATVHASSKEAGYWLDKARMAAAPESERQAFANAAAALKPYLASHRFQTFDTAAELLPGIRALPTEGHTPGHAIYAAESKGAKIIFWGDTMHVAAIQFENPTVASLYDVDPVEAGTKRAALFKETAERGQWVAGAHLSFPGIGHLRAAGRGYEFEPANYTVP